jgi:hypothetical protein
MDRYQFLPMGMGTSGAGMYFSGAMRCPKCHSDMKQIMIDGTMIRLVDPEQIHIWTAERR